MGGCRAKKKKKAKKPKLINVCIMCDLYHLMIFYTN